ncbi:MAG: 6-phosphogluconolactonase [Chloroflexi bacterium]|nr:6-phosphogluconolactonase [Chloroflexota bacterium]
MNTSKTEIFANHEELSQWAAARFAEIATRAVKARGRCLVALAGGGTPRRLYQLLAAPPLADSLPWAHIHWFWGDERCVPPDDAGSNYGQVRQIIFDRVPAPEENIHRMRGELPPKQAAQDYARQLRAYADAGLDWPRFDLVLLGLGADGHTASLFPGSPPDAGAASPTLAVTADYDGRPAQRVTLTPPVFNRARQVFFLVSGAEKADALAATLRGAHDPTRWPAQRIQPREGEVTWLADEAAARQLNDRSAS